MSDIKTRLSFAYSPDGGEIIYKKNRRIYSVRSSRKFLLTRSSLNLILRQNEYVKNNKRYSPRAMMSHNI
jgi:hypothetical protein